MIRAPGPYTCLGRCPLEVSTWPTISSSTCSKLNWLSSFQTRFLPGSSSQQTASIFTKSSRSEAGHHACLFLLYHTKNKGRGMKLWSRSCRWLSRPGGPQVPGKELSEAEEVVGPDPEADLWPENGVKLDYKESESFEEWEQKSNRSDSNRLMRLGPEAERAVQRPYINTDEMMRPEWHAYTCLEHSLWWPVFASFLFLC